MRERFSRRLRDGNTELVLEGEPTLAELLEVQAYFRLPSPAALVEKDFYVVKAFAAIAAVELEELHLRLVFGGGTALSRAHRLIRRMSEDMQPQHARGLLPRRMLLALGEKPEVPA